MNILPSHSNEFTAERSDSFGTPVNDTNRANSRLLVALNHSTEGIAKVDASGRLIWSNTSYTRILGHHSQELNALTWLDNVLPEYRNRASQAMRLAAIRGEQCVEFKGRRVAGDTFWGRLVVVAESENQECHGGYYLFLNDITEEMRAKESFSYHQTLLEAVLRENPDPMIICDSNRRIVVVNPAFTNVFGYTPEQALGRFTSFLYPSEEDYKKAGANYYNVQATASGATYEQAYRKRCGANFLSDTLATVLTDRTNRVIGYFAHIRDITERKRLEQVKKDFVSVVSHELRTPLTALSGALGLLQGGAAGELSAPAARLADLASRNSGRLMSLINDILDLDRFESGQVKLDIQIASVQPLLQDVVCQNLTYCQGEPVRLSLGQVANASVAIDSPRLGQVLNNLISNALKFSPEDSEVTVGARLSENTLRIFVADQGPGIPENFRPLVFDRFTQSDSSDTRTKGGSGLGLAISKCLVEAMNGLIGFDSECGKGTTFWVDLPLIQE